ISEGLKVPRRDTIPRGTGVIVGSGSRTAIHQHASTPIIVAERRVGADRYGRNAWNARKRIVNTSIKWRQLLGAISGKPGVDSHDNAPVLREAEFLMLEIVQSERQES